MLVWRSVQNSSAILKQGHSFLIRNVEFDIDPFVQFEVADQLPQKPQIRVAFHVGFDEPTSNDQLLSGGSAQVAEKGERLNGQLDLFLPFEPVETEKEGRGGQLAKLVFGFAGQLEVVEVDARVHHFEFASSFGGEGKAVEESLKSEPTVEPNAVGEHHAQLFHQPHDEAIEPKRHGGFGGQSLVWEVAVVNDFASEEPENRQQVRVGVHYVQVEFLVQEQHVQSQHEHFKNGQQKLEAIERQIRNPVADNLDSNGPVKGLFESAFGVKACCEKVCLIAL